VICKEEEFPNTDDESPVKNKKKDPNKVDKKYLCPHGITPSLKNVRKRRMRKTLKKKNVEAPEIEKEVKRLLRVDNEAVNVKWDVVECEEPAEDKDTGRDTPKGKKGASTSKGKAKNLARESLPVDEHILFGEEVSDDSEEDHANMLDIDDTRLSDDSHSRFSDSNSVQGMQSASNSRMATEFNKTMFEVGASSSFQAMDDESTDYMDAKDLNDSSRIIELQRELQDLEGKQNQMEMEVQTIDNKKLKERLQDNLSKLMDSIIMKRVELETLQQNQ